MEMFSRVEQIENTLIKQLIVEHCGLHFNMLLIFNVLFKSKMPFRTSQQPGK